MVEAECGSNATTSEKLSTVLRPLMTSVVASSAAHAAISAIRKVPSQMRDLLRGSRISGGDPLPPHLHLHAAVGLTPLAVMPAFPTPAPAPLLHVAQQQLREEWPARWLAEEVDASAKRRERAAAQDLGGADRNDISLSQRRNRSFLVFRFK